MTSDLDQKSIDYLVAAGITAVQEMISSLQAENKALREENEKLRQCRPAAVDGFFSFPEKLLRMRIEKGLTQRDLAVMTKTSCPLISKYETGQTRPRLKNILGLEKALGCPGELQGSIFDYEKRAKP